jgi:hypothetical protein
MRLALGSVMTLIFKKVYMLVQERLRVATVRNVMRHFWLGTCSSDFGKLSARVVPGPPRPAEAHV